MFLIVFGFIYLLKRNNETGTMHVNRRRSIPGALKRHQRQLKSQQQQPQINTLNDEINQKPLPGKFLSTKMSIRYYIEQSRYLIKMLQ